MSRAIFVAAFFPVTVLLLIFPVQALGSAADAMCNRYYAQCPCDQIPDPNNPGKCKQGGALSNTHACAPGVCKDTTNGKLTIGTCVAQNKCDATQTNGQAPQLPPGAPQQNGSQSQTSQSQSGAGTGALSGGAPQVTPDNPVSPPSGNYNSPGQSSSVQPDQTASQPAEGSPPPVTITPSNPGDFAQTAPEPPTFNETTGQWESLPSQDWNDESLYHTPTLSQPNQPGAVFNETTGQWERSSAPQPSYPMTVLSDNPLNPLQQQAGIPSYTEGDQSYQYAPEPTFEQSPQPAQVDPYLDPCNSCVFPFRDFENFPDTAGQPPAQYWLNQLYPGLGDSVEYAVSWPFDQLAKAFQLRKP
jgi:hypothetical protein